MLIAAVIIIFVCVACTTRVLYRYLRLYPAEPSAQGHFPIQPAWVFDASQTIVSMPVMLDERHILLRTKDALCKFDVQKQECVWRSQAGINHTSALEPQISGQQIVVTVKDADIASYSLVTGDFIWGSNSGEDDLGWSSAAFRVDDFVITNHFVFVTRPNDRLVCYQLKNGHVLWSVWLPTHSMSYLAADASHVYLAAHQSLTAYELATGTEAWHRDFDTSLGPILIDGQTLYVTSGQNDILVRAFDLETLTERWHVSSSQVGMKGAKHLTAFGDKIYVSGIGLAAIDKDSGGVLWTALKGEYLDPAVEMGFYVFIRDQIGPSLFMLDRLTGQKVGSLVVQTDAIAPSIAPPRYPAVFGDLLIVPFGDSRIFAYRP